MLVSCVGSLMIWLVVKVRDAENGTTNNVFG